MEPVEENLSFVDLCYGVIFQPRETFGRIAEKPPVAHSAVLVILVGILLSLTNVYVGVPTALKQASAAGDVPDEVMRVLVHFTEPRVLLLTGLAGLVFSLIWWLIYSAIYHMAAEIFGGQGSAKGVLSVTGLSHLPKIFIIPVSVITYAANGPGSINSWISFVLFIYTAIYLPALGIAQVHHLSFLRSVATVMVPVGLILFSIFLVMLVSIIILAGQFGSAF